MRKKKEYRNDAEEPATFEVRERKATTGVGELEVN